MKMKTAWNFLLCLGVGISCWFFYAVAASGDKPAPTPAPARVAVVDIDKVLEDWKEATEDKIRLKGQLNELETDLKKRVEELKAIEQSAKLLEGKAKADKEAEFSSKKGLFDALRSHEQEKLFRRQVENFTRWYERINQAAVECAQSRGVDLVLVADAMPKMAFAEKVDDLEAAFGAFQREVGMRRVLYAKPEMDITQQVTDRLNSGKPSK